MCGKKGADGHKFCMVCGSVFESEVGSNAITYRDSSVEDFLQPESTTECENLTPKAASPFKRTEKKLEGIEGWLALFCVKMTVFAALYSVYYAIHTADSFGALSTLAMGAFEIYTGISVWNVSSKAIRNLKIYFATAIALGVIFIAIGMMSNADEKQTQELIVSGWKTIFSALAWGLYFVRSKRVKNTLGRNLFGAPQ
jgi:hypothetical protein